MVVSLLYQIKERRGDVAERGVRRIRAQDLAEQTHIFREQFRAVSKRDRSRQSRIHLETVAAAAAHFHDLAERGPVETECRSSAHSIMSHRNVRGHQRVVDELRHLAGADATDAHDETAECFEDRLARRR